AGLLNILGLAHPDVGGEFLALGDSALGAGRPGRQRALHHFLGQFQQMVGIGGSGMLARVPPRIDQAVPPTVMRSIRMVGMPTPTGTLCPFLPHTPMPSSRRISLPTRLTYCSASGPLPMSVALRTGRVSRPSSIR